MGDTDELIAWLRQKHQEMPKPEAGSFYSEAADELMRLGGRLAEADTNADLAYADATRAEDEVTYWKARARRAEADADRLAEEFAQRTHCICDLHLDTACVHCVVLNLHDKEVEAR